MLVQASDKLSFHWDRVASLLDGKLDSYPITVHVGPMAGCNQDCVWCSDLDYRRKYAGYLDVDRFIPILGEWAAGGVCSVVWIGSGEPTYHPHFIPLVKAAAAVGLKQGLVTNGVRLPVAYLDHFAWVRVSLDAGSATTYEQLHRSPDYDQVCVNLVAAQRRKSCILGVSFLGCADNSGELQALARWLDRIGVDYLHVKQIAHTLRYKDRPIPPSEHSISESFSHLKLLIDRTDPMGGNAGLPCWASSLNTVVGPTGDVFLCCRLVGVGRDQDAWLGNLYDGFDPVWRGDRRKEVVARFLKTSETSRCPTCWMTAFNQALHEKPGVPSVVDHSDQMWFV